MHISANYYVTWTNVINGHKDYKQKPFEQYSDALQFAKKVGGGHELVIYNHDSAVVYGNA